MKALILGSGGREHALGWAIREEDPSAELLFCPGNGGTGRREVPPGSSELPSRNVPLRLDDLPALVDLARSERVDLTLVGPEVPLVAGVVDRFREAGLSIFGPTARAAAIEGSKVFAKTLMRDNGVPTPSFDVFATPEEARAAATRGMFPKVIKADGLAAGKGVIIARTRAEAERAISEIMEQRRFGHAGDQVLVESYAEGEEISAFAIAREEEFRLLPLAQDHKRIGEGDTGPNTGGMGAYAPVPWSSPQLRHVVEEEVFAPVLGALARAGRPFSGLLYAGLILRHGRPSVLEFNCRFGDPETQAIVPLLGDGFLQSLLAVATGKGALAEIGPAHARGRSPAGAAATIVLASEGYPGPFRSGFPITGIDKAEEIPGICVFHAGTRREGDRLLTAGGRVLAVTGRGADLKEALHRAYEASSLISFEGKCWRRDIGRRGLSAAG